MYDRPEILEVGQAEFLTLGCMGTAVDKCDYGVAPNDDTPQLPGPGGG